MYKIAFFNECKILFRCCIFLKVMRINQQQIRNFKTNFKKMPTLSTKNKGTLREIITIFFVSLLLEKLWCYCLIHIPFISCLLFKKSLEFFLSILSQMQFRECHNFSHCVSHPLGSNIELSWEIKWHLFFSIFVFKQRTEGATPKYESKLG